MRTLIIRPSTNIASYGANLKEYIERIIDALRDERCLYAKPRYEGDTWTKPLVAAPDGAIDGAECLIVIDCDIRVDWESISNYARRNNLLAIACVRGFDGGGNLIFMDRDSVHEKLKLSSVFIAESTYDIIMCERERSIGDVSYEDGRWNWWGLD